MEYICAGQIGKPIGIRGYAKIQSFMCSTHTFLSFKNKFYLSSDLKLDFSNLEIWRNTNNIIGKIANIHSRNEIERFKFQNIFIRRCDCPTLQQNEYYYCDLIKLPVFANTGEYLGIVESVQNYGAGDFLEILLEKNAYMKVADNAQHNNGTVNGKNLRNENIIATIPFNKEAILDVQKEKIIVNTRFILI